MSRLIGEILSQYHVLEEIGRGGMAVVYRAYQPSLQRFVAVKVLPPQFTFDTTFIQRFQQEARVAARLEHSNIVTIYDVGEQGGVYYIVMEYLEGLPLNELLRREGALPLERVIHIVAQIASALDYAHAQGFVHRDIKPSNIIMGSDGHATLTDFGIAKAAEGTRLTLTGTVIGTPEYISPEQAKGEAVGPATDVYSLGIVVYEMLAGRVPFEADSTPAILYKQAHERPGPVRTHAPHLPAAVEGVLAKALAKEPARRYRSAGELARALERVLKGKPFHYQETEPPTLATTTVGKKRMSWVMPVLGGLLVLTLVILAAFGLGSRDSGSTPSPAAVVMVSETASPSPTATTPSEYQTGTPTKPPKATQSTLISTPTPHLEPSVEARVRATQTAEDVMQSGTVTPELAPFAAVIQDKVNVREGPGTAYEQMGQVTEGQELNIVGKNPAGDWWQVCCVDSQQVWIIGQFVQAQGNLGDVQVVVNIPPPPPTPTPRPTPTPTLAAQCQPWHQRPAPGYGMLLIENHVGEELSMDHTIGGSGHWIVAAKGEDIAGRWWMELPVGYHEFKYMTAPRGGYYMYGRIKVSIEERQSYISPLWLNELTDDLVFPMEIPAGCR